MCIVCGPGGNRFLQATSARYGGSGPQRFAAEEVLRETTPALDPLNREDLEGSADVILRGGPILTMRRPGEVAAAMALRSGRIQRLGDEDDVLPLRGRLTRVIDLAGRAVAPGFINAHWHAPVSLLFDWLEWIDPASTEAILAAGRNGAGEWLVVQCAQKDAEAHAIARDALGRIERPAALVDEKCNIVFANATAHANPAPLLRWRRLQRTSPSCLRRSPSVLPSRADRSLTACAAHSKILRVPALRPRASAGSAASLAKVMLTSYAPPSTVPIFCAYAAHSACSCLRARLTLRGMQGSVTIRSGWTRQRPGSAIGNRKTLSSSERPANAMHGAGT